MDIKSGNFDKARAIMYLDCEHRLLAARVLALESGAPSANMDAGGRGATLYLGPDIKESVRLALRNAGYPTNVSLRGASDQDLLKVSGVGPAMLKKIRAELK